MLLSVTLVTVIAVWSTLCTLSTFYAIPKQGVNGSGKAGKTNETEINNKTCYHLTMLDDSKNKCYVPCKQWEWRNTPEKLLRNAATYITSLTSLVSVTIMIITWIKLKHL
jgi:hypothetical protein